MESRFVEAGGVRLHVRDYGRPSGAAARPLVFVHSTGFGEWMWRPIAEALAGRFHVFATDQRGHGDSDKTPDGIDFPTMAADIEAICASLGLEDAGAIGHSSGGTTLVHHAAYHPGRIGALLLVEPILPLGPSWQPADGTPTPTGMAERARKRKPGFASAAEMFESFRPRPPFNTWREDILRLYCDEGTTAGEGGVVLKCPPEFEARVYEAVAAYDARAALDRFAMPARLLWGETGVRGPKRVNANDPASVPGAKSETVVGTSHFVPMEKPEVIVQEALDFFGGRDA